MLGLFWFIFIINYVFWLRGSLICKVGVYFLIGVAHGLSKNIYIFFFYLYKLKIQVLISDILNNQKDKQAFLMHESAIAQI
jgi:hypothetical protein